MLGFELVKEPLPLWRRREQDKLVPGAKACELQVRRHGRQMCSIGASDPLKEGVAQFVAALQERLEASVSAGKHLCVDVLEGGKL